MQIKPTRRLAVAELRTTHYDELEARGTVSRVQLAVEGGDAAIRTICTRSATSAISEVSASAAPSWTASWWAMIRRRPAPSCCAT
jgi:hypothetical protein